MRIILSANVSDPVVGQEYVGDNAEGEFVTMPDGAISYRHPSVGVLFANVSREAFVACAHAWKRYCDRVVLEADQKAQLRVVDELRRELQAEDGLRPGSFWEIILEQAEDGQL